MSLSLSNNGSTTAVVSDEYEKAVQRLGQQHKFMLDRWNEEKLECCPPEATNFVEELEYELQNGRNLLTKFDEMKFAVNIPKKVQNLVEQLHEKQNIRDFIVHLQFSETSKRKLDKQYTKLVNNEKHLLTEFTASSLPNSRPYELGVEIAETMACFHEFCYYLNVIYKCAIQNDVPNHNLIWQNRLKLLEEWITKLLTLLSQFFEASFQLVQWPKPKKEIEDTLNKKPVKSHEIELFTIIFRALLELDTGLFLSNTNENAICKLPCFKVQFNTSHPTSVDQLDPQDNELVSQMLRSKFTAIKLMINPLFKRFEYFFLNPKSKLNSIENPEWYLCQVEQWITEHESFLTKEVDKAIFGDKFDDCVQSVAKVFDLRFLY